MSGDVIDSLLAWHDKSSKSSKPDKSDKSDIVLAVVAKTWGSAPRPVGSFMALRSDGEFVGSVSGGCVEAAVIEEGQALLAGKIGAPKLLEYGVSTETAWSVGLACGGSIEVLLQMLSCEQLELLRSARDRLAAREASLLEFSLTKGLYALRRSDEVRDKGLDDSLEAEALRFDRAHRTRDDDWRLLVPKLPVCELFIIGAVHIAQILLRLAQVMGWSVILIDPRESWLTDARFPKSSAKNLTLDRRWPDQALAGRLGFNSAVVCLSHDPKLDDPAIIAALNAKVFYLGCLSGKATNAKRKQRLSDQHQLSEEDLSVIHAPIGLDLGGRGSEEIALAIVAQIVKVRRSNPKVSGG